ncbi:uncharacterized protein LOC125857766 isoform X1 [Solanum stenotomum]|uniref:uncharacterized protein LOC125857766 isoform X1 n=1 Tax=Solanum stenotomum TaxID=172797 RepID=UPI0020D01C43|nr:uncharacterized protein LOC125857766 isoform X1 [Solanum stenotomum]
MTLAVHMSLWHDVQLHWEMMQNKGRSIVHMPSFCFDAGMAAGIGALIVIIVRSHAQAFGNKSLDKSAPLLDMIVEGQDLEKFSVFYRFAKFHGRGQSSGVESSSTDAAARSHKPFLQRYVTVLPMPQNLPDRRFLWSLVLQARNGHASSQALKFTWYEWEVIFDRFDLT